MRTRIRPILLIAGLALALVPAGAQPVAAGSGNQCADTSLSALATTHPTARGEGNTAREPDLNVSYQDLPASSVGKGKLLPDVVTVPVWFHVVHNNGIGNVSDADIVREIRIMNLGFSGAYGGYDQGFRFELAGVTRTDNEEWYFAGPSSPGEREMKQALRQGDMGTLNYYSTTAGAYLGWAYLPGLSDGIAYLDGIVVDWESMFKTSDTYKNRYDLGLTAVHEAGHWFGLEHTFYGGCNSNGDYVADTPAEKAPTSGCPADGTKDTCTKDAGFDPIHNYMDYSYDVCYTEFTQGQAARARDFWVEFRG